MVKFGGDAQVVRGAEPGEYLFKIYEVNEKVSQAGNPYWQVKFETKDGLKVCDNFMFTGKAASKTLSLLTGLGIADGESFPTGDIEPDEILGKFVTINVIKDKDSNFLKCPWGVDDYKPYTQATKKVKQPVITEEIPF